jgi:hypothetical protein
MRDPMMGSFFFLLALLAATSALLPRTRKRLRWGRADGAIPISAVGACSWAGAFALVAVASFGWIHMASLFASVPLVVCAGFYDTWRFRRQSKPQQRTRS